MHSIVLEERRLVLALDRARMGVQQGPTRWVRRRCRIRVAVLRIKCVCIAQRLDRVVATQSRERSQWADLACLLAAGGLE